MQRQVPQARIQTAQVEGSKRQKKMATADEPPSVPIVPPTAKAASIKPPRTWRPRQDGDLRGMAAVSVEPKVAALEKIDEGIIDVFHGRDNLFSANGLSFLMEFHKDHSATDLYGMTPENREIVELALKNAKAKGLLITSGSDLAIQAVFQANREARARGMLEYLRQYFTVTPANTIFGLTIEERAQVSRLDDYLMVRDALAKARRALREEVEASNPLKIKESTDGTPGTASPMVEGGPDDPFFGHEAEDDPTLGISDEEYEGILEMVEEKTLATGGCEVEEEAGGGNQQEPKEVSMNMVLVLPSEFSAPGGQTNSLDNDVAEEQLDQRPKTKEELLAVAFNEVIPRDEPNKYRHLKPLYISGHVEGVPVSKVFVDCGATVNILPYSLTKKLDKSKEDLIPSDMVMSSFVGDKSKTIDVDYNILLGRDQIHQSGYIPSSLFQLLFFWDGQRVSIHPVAEKPFETNAVQARRRRWMGCPHRPRCKRPTNQDNGPESARVRRRECSTGFGARSIDRPH
ncbi:unnamed protein product [Prunus brigantina]